MRIKHKLWLEDDSGVLFGRGRFSLLSAVEELGSLSAAAKRMKMSYRAAWGRLRASEERLGMDLLEKAPVGRGLVLTPQAKRLLELYRRFDRDIEEMIEERGRELFGAEPELNLKLDGTR